MFDFKKSINYSLHYICIIGIKSKLNFFRNPPTLLSPDIHYENMMALFNKNGYCCRTPAEIEKSIQEALKVLHFKNRNSFFYNKFILFNEYVYLFLIIKFFYFIEYRWTNHC